MKIKVRLFAYLREGRDKELILYMEDGDTVEEVLERLDLDYKEVSILLINGRNASIDSLLIEGDIVSLFPPIGGG